MVLDIKKFLQFSPCALVCPTYYVLVHKPVSKKYVDLDYIKLIKKFKWRTVRRSMWSNLYDLNLDLNHCEYII